MWIGTKLYDFIAGKQRAVPRSYFISAEEASFQFPMLNTKNLKGGIVYYDGQHNDSRMNLLIALTAAQVSPENIASIVFLLPLGLVNYTC